MSAVVTREPWAWDAGELAAAFAARSLSPVEVFHSVAARMRCVQPLLNPMACWDEEGALAAARASEARWQRGAPRSALDGIPLTVKDNIPVAHLPCRWGSRLYADHVPTRDELPVARLRAAGAVLLGKTNVPEFTLLGYTDNLVSGVTRNPWDPALTPGGSSGGAVVAVATGIGPLALATDGGGSIRRPCSHAGLAGLKPSWGRVPREHGLPELLPGLEVVGPIARTVGDLVRLLGVIGPGPAPFDATVKPQRIVCWRDIAGGPVDAQVLARLDDAVLQLRELGHAVEVRTSPTEVDAFNRQAWPAIGAHGLTRLLAPHAEHANETALADRLTPAMRELWRAGKERPPSALDDAHRVMERLRAAVAGVLSEADLILTPSAAALPWPARDTHPPLIDGREAGPRGHAAFTAFVNACGLPALAIPMAPSREGLPIGMQLVGRAGADDALCALGLQWEAAHPWRHRWPTID